MDTPDDDLRSAGDDLASAMDRRAAALRRMDRVASTFRAQGQGGTTASDAASRLSSDAAAQASFDAFGALVPHVAVLVHRCGLFGDAAPPSSLPECEGLSVAVATCTRPTTGTSVAEHLGHCRAELATVRSSDPKVSAALDALTHALGELAVVTERLTMSPAELAAHVRELASASSARRSADADAERSAARIRASCSR